jgi:mono/diheme cytochrome c family protein
MVGSRFGAGVGLSAALVALLYVAAGVAPAEEPNQSKRVANPFEGRADLVDEGRSLFNQYCSHCHGPNAQQGERPRDLRRLKLRYGDDAPEVFYTTINNGRLELGMPVWKGVLSEDVMWRIFTFLETQQATP